MERSNLIEGLWRDIKLYIERIYVTISGSARLEDFVFESLWRRQYEMIDNSKKNDFILHTFYKVNTY